jgi:hypothetical protein
MTDLFRDLAAAGEPRALTTGPWIRRGVTVVFASVVVLALLDVFGQVPSESAATTPRAVLRLSAPAAVRGGLFFESRVEIRALAAIQHPRLVLDPGWFEGMQFNSIEPSPVGEVSRGRRIVFSYDTLKAGDTMTVWLQFEANPTTVGRQSYGIELDDAETPVARLERDLTVFP